MTSGALCSDHVNYLILRYLQEAGHETAATAFWRDWHRVPEYRDPENYPFAPVVRRGELVNVIQDGLHHDELIARVKKDERKFQFTSLTSREGLVERREREVLENGTAGSRPSSGAKRKGRPPTMRPPDEFPTPAPKRQRRSEGSEGVHLNGDAMDVDAASASADAEGDEDGEAVSPTIASEPEIIEVPERYDSMDVAVQTEVKTGPKTSTMYWRIDKPNATIYHSAWSPSTDPKSVNTLLTVGDSLCRFYQVPDDVNTAKQVGVASCLSSALFTPSALPKIKLKIHSLTLPQILSIDEPSLPPSSMVTASAWHPEGHTVAWAVDSVRELPGGRQESHQVVCSQNRDSGSSCQYLCPPLIEQPSIVLKIQYSHRDNYLLVARTNLKRSLVLVYDTRVPGAEKAEPVAWRILEHAVLDFACGESVGFIVCGENGLFSTLRIDVERIKDFGGRPYASMNDPLKPEDSYTAEAILMHGLTQSRQYTFDRSGLNTPPRRWDKVRHAAYSVSALVSSEDKILVMEATDSITWTNLPGQVTALAFQPSFKYGDEALLAVAFEEGGCSLYTKMGTVPGKAYGIHQIHAPLLTVHLSDGPALALAWSADGKFLALGGTDLVQVWETDALVYWQEHRVETVTDSLHEPLVTWRPDTSATGPRNGEHEPDRPLTEPSLSWSADGQSLSFAHDKQVSLLSITPLP